MNNLFIKLEIKEKILNLLERNIYLKLDDIIVSLEFEKKDIIASIDYLLTNKYIEKTLKNNELYYKISFKTMQKKILVVDDEINILNLIKLSLKDKYNLTLVNSSKNALDKINREKFDLILLDIMMPDIDGLKLLKYIRSRPQISKTPIFLLSAKSQIEDKVNGLELGANDYITKPFSPKELLARIDRFIQMVDNFDVDINTKLPGKDTLLSEMKKIIIKKNEFHFDKLNNYYLFFLTFDYLNEYEKVYGYKRSDNVLRYFSRKILYVLQSFSSSFNLLIQSKRNQFVLLTNISNIDMLIEKIKIELEEVLFLIYDKKDNNYLSENKDIIVKYINFNKIRIPTIKYIITALKINKNDLEFTFNTLEHKSKVFLSKKINFYNEI
jgi:CheY-like chemotaxis protein/GGDEF domain-containing protein